MIESVKISRQRLDGLDDVMSSSKYEGGVYIDDDTWPLLRVRRAKSETRYSKPWQTFYIDSAGVVYTVDGPSGLQKAEL